MVPVIDAPRPRTAAVLTISDRCSRGEQADHSGDLLVERIGALPAVLTSRRVVSDDVDQIGAAVITLTKTADLLITTGGTGLAPRDVTPEAVVPLLDRQIPGMGEAMRVLGMAQAPVAMLSRQVCGTRGRCLVLALPGSPQAVDDCLNAVWATLPHALDLVTGRVVSHPLPAG